MTMLSLDERQLAMVDYALRDNLLHIQEQIADHEACGSLGMPCKFMLSNAVADDDDPKKVKYSCYRQLMQLHEEAAILAGTLYQIEEAERAEQGIARLKDFAEKDKDRDFTREGAEKKLGELLNESGQHDEGTTTAFKIPKALIDDLDGVKDVPPIVPDPEFEIDPRLLEKLHPKSEANRYDDEFLEDLKEKGPNVYLPPWPEEEGFKANNPTPDNSETQLIHPIVTESEQVLHDAEERRGFLSMFDPRRPSRP